MFFFSYYLFFPITISKLCYGIVIQKKIVNGTNAFSTNKNVSYAILFKILLFPSLVDETILESLFPMKNMFICSSKKNKTKPISFIKCYVDRQFLVLIILNLR